MDVDRHYNHTKTTPLPSYPPPSLSCPCLFLVSYWLVSVLSLSFPCNPHVLSLSCPCHVPVLSLSRPCMVPNLLFIPLPLKPVYLTILNGMSQAECVYIESEEAFPIYIITDQCYISKIYANCFLLTHVNLIICLSFVCFCDSIFILSIFLKFILPWEFQYSCLCIYR